MTHSVRTSIKNYSDITGYAVTSIRFSFVVRCKRLCKIGQRCNYAVESQGVQWFPKRRLDFLAAQPVRNNNSSYKVRINYIVAVTFERFFVT